jgi:hypothetical protein
MKSNDDVVPNLFPGMFMTIRAGAEVLSLKRGKYTLVRKQTVQLSHYQRGLAITPDMAFNDRDYRSTLEERGMDLSPFLELRETNRAAFYNERSILIYKPKAVWAGSGNYWVSTDIDNVIPA